MRDLVCAAAAPDRLTELVSASALTYAFVMVLVAADAVLPAVPGEAVVITAAVLAADGALSVVLVVAAATAGSFAGDNMSYLLGAKIGAPAAHRLLRGDRGRHLLDWAEHQLRERGRVVVVAARFIPAGRTATTFACGAVGMPWRWFAGADAIAATLWACYVTTLGYVGGSTFRHQQWKALALSFAVALAVALGAELLRRVRAQRA